MFQHDYNNVLPDMNRYGEYFATNEEYIRKYRFCNAFHPLHGSAASAVIVASTRDRVTSNRFISFLFCFCCKFTSLHKQTEGVGRGKTAVV